MAATKALVVSAFGGLRIKLPNGEIAQLHTHRARALFVLLLIHRDRMVHREVLCNQLWPDLDESAARSHLRKALWRIRVALGPDDAPPVIRIAEHQVGLDATQIDADCWRFADAVDALELKADREMSREEAQALIAAIDLNQGTFAAGLFDDWCLAEQDLLRQARIEAMARIVGYHRSQENWCQAIHWAQRALALDPAREDLHYAVMACRFAMGDRTSALRQYGQCEQVLRRDFGIAPSPELRAFRHHISQPEGDPPVRQQAPRPAAGQGNALARDVDGVITSLAAVRDRLDYFSPES